MKATSPRWGREKVRTALGLKVWEIELAVETGLFARGEDRRFDPAEVQTALDSGEEFRARLRAEYRLNATEAAGLLGISKQRFARVVEQTGLRPVAEEQIRKYGQILTVRSYRTADVEALAPYATADRVLRGAVTSVGRSAAAQKAARTRARNKARAAEARSELDTVREAAGSSPVAALRYAAALACDLPDSPHFLRRYEHDDVVHTLARVIADCRLTAAERRAYLADVQDLALQAHSTMAGPDEVRQRLGTDVSILVGRTETVCRFVPRPELSQLASAPPEWLLSLRAAEAATDAEESVLRARLSAERKVLDAAERALCLTDETAAELFGLPVDVVAALRPRSRRTHWHPQHVAQLLARPPVWLRNEAAARQEVARRRAHRKK